jgi:aldehyde:ferredoxin oxidoreductase
LYSLKGYAGSLLRVDLSKKKTGIRKLQKGFVRNYLGGRGFASRILYDEITKDIDPLGPKNLLIFVTGPLNGTVWPQTGRYDVYAKSPLTKIWGESNSGGHLGSELKYAGFDAVIFEGVSEKPVYIWIDNDEVEIRDADALWGKNTSETDQLIKEELRDGGIEIACIGQAGENLVKYAAIMTRLHCAAARSGIGAVMGSKRLKAIAVRGSNNVELAHQDRFHELADKARERLTNHPFTKSLTEYGTPMLVEAMNEIGRFPTKNYQTGVFPSAEDIGGEVLNKKYKIGHKACFNCPIGCKQHFLLRKSPFADWMKGEDSQIEYESLSALGGRCWNGDLDAVLYCNDLCDKYGLDTTGVGGAIAFAMECYEKGLLTKADTEGIDLRWGDAEIMTEMVNKIARREGFGDFLAEGVRIMADKMGEEAKKYAMHVKGADISAQDGRAQKSMGLAHVTAARGADHLYAYPTLDEIGFEDAVIERFGKQYLPEISDRLSPRYKGLMVKECEDLCAIADSLVVCKFGVGWPPVFFFSDLAEAVSAATGFKMDEKELRLMGEKIVNLNRAFNVRMGMTRRDDTLPQRFLREPAPQGPCKGQVVELDQMLNEYYEYRQWDVRTGIPTSAKLKRVGLVDVAEDLRKLKFPDTSRGKVRC